MNLGLGLIAADEYFKEGDRRKEREYIQRKRDAEMSMLDDKTASDRSAYQLGSARNRSAMATLPQEEANRTTRLGLEGATLAGQQKRQPVEEQTKDIQANMGLSNAQSDQTNQPKAQEVKNNTLQGQVLQSRSDLAMLPEKIRQAAVSGKLNAQGQGEIVLGTLGQLIARQDKNGALEFANQIAKVSDILPNTNGKTFTDITPVRGGKQGDGYNFTTSDGETRFVPVQAIQMAMGKLKSGEYQFIHTGDGSVYSGNKSTGQVTQAFQGNPALTGKQHTPSEIQTMNYLIENKVARDHNQAWEMVRGAREKTRSSFVMDHVAKNAMPGQDSRKVAEQAGAIYDDLRKSQGSAADAAKGGGSPNWNEWTQ